jgi:hypothetical protein
VSFASFLATADRSVRGILGGPVTYTPGTGAPVVVQGVFDAAFVHADLGEAGVSTSGPAVFLTLADLPSDPSADLAATVTVGGITYKPREVQPDGLGGVRLLLRQTS